MAVVASDRLTLATLPSPSYVRTYYLKQASTLSPPAQPTTNPPTGSWSTTEPTFVQNETATVYTVMLTAYGTVSFEYGPVQKSSSYEAAKQAYNQAVASGQSATDAYNAAIQAQNDLANLEIGGRNILLDSLSWGSMVLAGTPRPVFETTDRGGRLTQQGQGTGQYGYVWYHGRLTDDMYFQNAGEKYTLSVDIKASLSSGTFGHFRIDTRTPSQQYSPEVRFYDTGGAWVRLSTTITIQQVVNSQGIIIFTFSGQAELGDVIEWRDLKLERGNKATDWTPAPEDVDAGITDARTKAENALDQLTNKPDKSYVDNQIILSANGKNKVTTSLNAPTVSGSEVEGDLWRRHNASGHVFQEFTWRGSWVPTLVTSDMVTNLDVHKLTVSGDATFTTAVADEIWSEIVRARLIVATELIAGDIIVKNTLSADRLKAKTITAESGVIADATIDTAQIIDAAITTAKIENLAVDNAKIKDINAGKITTGFVDAARIATRSLATDRLLIGSFDNLFNDVRFEDTRGYIPGVPSNGVLTIPANATVNPSWLVINIDPDEKHVVQFQKVGAGNLTFQIHSSDSPTGPFTHAGAEFNTSTDEGNFEIFVDPLDKRYVKWVAINGGSVSYLSNIRVNKVFSGTRIEDGSITTEKITVGGLTADAIAADSIGSAHISAGSITSANIGAGQILADNIGVGAVTAEAIEAGSINSNHIQTESITTENLSAGAVTFDKIQLGAVRGEHLDPNSITKEQFVGAANSELGTIIERSHAIAESVIIDPGKITLTSNRVPIGGQNLLVDSYKGNWGSNEDQVLDVYFGDSKPLNGETVTLSIKGQLAETANGFLIYNSGFNSLGAPLITNDFQGTDGVYTVTFDWIVGGTNTYIKIQQDKPQQDYNDTTIEWVKLERGSQATPWTDYTLGDSLGTSLSLTSTRQTFTVEGKEVVYIDSQEEAMNIKNVIVEKSIKVGNHIIDSLSSDVTIFTWAGEA